MATRDGREQRTGWGQASISQEGVTHDQIRDTEQCPVVPDTGWGGRGRGGFVDDGNGIGRGWMRGDEHSLTDRVNRNGVMGPRVRGTVHTTGGRRVYGGGASDVNWEENESEEGDEEEEEGEEEDEEDEEGNEEEEGREGEGERDNEGGTGGGRGGQKEGGNEGGERNEDQEEEGGGPGKEGGSSEKARGTGRRVEEGKGEEQGLGSERGVRKEEYCKEEEELRRAKEGEKGRDEVRSNREQELGAKGVKVKNQHRERERQLSKGLRTRTGDQKGRERNKRMGKGGTSILGKTERQRSRQGQAGEVGLEGEKTNSDVEGCGPEHGVIS